MDRHETDSDQAVIVTTGEWIDIRRMKKTYEDNAANNDSDSDQAVIVTTGEWIDMRRMKKTYEDNAANASSSTSTQSSPSPPSSPDQAPPPAKRKRLTVLKPEARVLGWVDGLTRNSTEDDPYEFRSETPSPVLPLNLDPPTPPATETPIQPLPELNYFHCNKYI